MERRKFTREFKLEAVKLIRKRGVAVTQAPQPRRQRPPCGVRLATPARRQRATGDCRPAEPEEFWEGGTLKKWIFA